MSTPYFDQARLSFLFFIVFLVTASTAMAQQAARLAGTVLDPEGGSVPAATVELYPRESGNKLSTSTDAEGTFEFSGLAAGSYLLQVRAPGFTRLTTERIDLATGAGETRVVRLDLAKMQTEVVVTASSTPLMLEEVAKTTDVVDVEEIALRDEYSIAESVRLIPGFRVKQTRGPGSLTTIHVRGLPSHNTALLVDGIRMRDSADPQGSGSPVWENLMVVSPDRVEVLRGSGSSLYGSHAMGGLVNVVSDSGGGKPHGEFLAEGGGMGMMRGLAKIGGGAFENRLLYSGGLTHINVTKGLDDVNPYRNTSGQGSVKYSLAPGMSIGGRAFLTGAFTRLVDSPYVPFEMEANLPASGVARGVPLGDSQVRLIEQGLPYETGNATYVPSVNDGDYNRVASFANVSTNFSHQVSPILSYRASYQFVDTNRRFDDGPGGVRWEPLVSSHSGYDGRIHLLQGRADLQAGRHNLISGGYEYEDESYFNRNTDEHPDPALQTRNSLGIGQRSHSVFAQDQISLLDRNLTISLSGRMQAFRLDEPEFTGGDSPYEGIDVGNPQTAWTGDAAVGYLFRSTGTKLRAHLGNSYRAPAAFERFGSSFFFGSFSPYGDPLLRPERAVSLDTGFDQWLANSSVRVSATYFYTRLQEIIFFDFSGMIPPDDPYGRFGGYLNIPGGLTRGVEFSVNARPTSSTVINGSYTYSDSTVRDPWDFEGQVNRSLGISDNMFTLLVSQWIGRRANITLDLFAADNYYHGFYTMSGTRAFDLDGYVKADLTGKYVLPVGETTSIEIYGKVENLFNQRFYETGYRAPGTWAIGGMRFLF